MFGRIARTSRRVLFGGLLLTLFLLLSWVTGIGVLPEDFSELSGAVEIGIFVLALLIVVGMLIGGPAIVLAVVAPGMLPLIDLVAMALVLGIPMTLAMTALDLPYWAYCLGLFGIFLVLQKVFYGPWLKGFMAKDSQTYRMAFEVPEAPETVWARLAPLPENERSYHWPKATFTKAPDGSDADFTLTSPRRSGLKDAVEAVWIEDLSEGQAITIRTKPLNGGAAISERFSLSVRPVGPRTRVEIGNTFLEASLFHRFRIWLNNDPRDFGVCLRNRAQGRRDGSVHGRQVLPA